jgi:hypothetical protein
MTDFAEAPRPARASLFIIAFVILAVGLEALWIALLVWCLTGFF